MKSRVWLVYEGRRPQILLADARPHTAKGSSAHKSRKALEHRSNIGCMVLMYWWVKSKCSTEIKQVLPPTNFFTRARSLSERSHPLVLEWPRYRLTHFLHPLLFNQTAPLWNNLQALMFPLFNKTYTSITPSSRSPLPTTLPASHHAGSYKREPLSDWSKQKNSLGLPSGTGLMPDRLR